MASIKKISRWVLYAVLTLLLVLALIALAIRFIIFPNIDSYKDDIAAHASKTAGQKITIGDIETGWNGISPHFVLKNIDVFDAENRTALHLNDVSASVSWLSVPLLQPRLYKLVIENPELTIRRKADGSIYLAGISLAGESKPELPNWLLSQSRIRIKNAQITWLDELRQAPPLALKQLDLTLRNPTINSTYAKHQFEISATPSVGTTQLIRINGSFVGGDVSKINTWYGNVNAQFKQADLSVWRAWIDYPFDLKTGMGNAIITLDFDDAKIEKVGAQTALTNVTLVLNKETTPFIAKQLSGNINWGNLNNTQTMSAKNIRLISNSGLNINNGNGSLTTSTKNGKAWYKADLHLDRFDLAAIKQLAPYFKLPADIHAKLNGFSAVGELQALQVGYEGDASKPETYKINANFKKLGLRAYDKIPGFSNLSGKILADEDGGELMLDAQNAMLDLKDILRWPIPADKLMGVVNWRINGKKAKINAEELYITSSHVTGTINVSYDNNVKGGYLNLTGKFSKGDAKYALFYYPVVLGKPTLQWLDTSILAGHAEDVNLAVKGYLADFPFVNSKNQPDPKLGTFKVTAKISDALLEFGTGWPMIEGLSLDMLFEGKRMELNANKGRIFGNKIIKSKTVIPQLDADWPMLHIVSEVEGPVVEGIKFVNNSPVKEVTQGFTDDLKTAGNGKLNLELNIPMEDLEAAKYKGVYKISNGTIFANDDVGLPELTKLNGILSFTENSFTAQNVTTEVLGGPARFSLKTGADKIIRVSANGRVNDAGIKKLTANPLADRMQGSADWAGEITIKKPLLDAKIQSNLVGMAINLPPPFNKPASQSILLTLDKKQQSSSYDSINIGYGDLVSAKLLRTEQAGKLTLERGDIGVFMPAELSNQTGLSVHGKLDYVNADDWLALFNQTPKSTGTNTTPLRISKANVAIQKIDIFGRSLHALKVVALPNNTGLKMAIESEEISGDAEWQAKDSVHTSGKIIARLKNLTIPADSGNKPKEAKADVVKNDIRKLANGYPALDVVADNFQLGNKKLGSLTLNAFENNDDWVIQKINITNPDSTLIADGVWQNWTRNPNTSLNFVLKVDNIGKALKRFDQPDAVKGGTAEIDGLLSWAGSPHEFETTSLNGNFKLVANKGQIVKVQPGVGRLFGLLSLQSLPRRLSLDFRDLFSDGFAFDKISANAKINNGILRSDNFFMTGPAAEAKIKGETNLKTETQNLTVQVIPHVSDSLSLAALAGGPIVGAAAFVAQKILKDPFNKIASSEYVITGTWDNPKEIESGKNEANKPNNGSPMSR
ncbi:MAG TPA: YhdP family protein [Methylotenera sp.]|nr:YhdP family protein [Methylotenera sp.]